MIVTNNCEASIGRWISILHRYRKYYVSRRLEPLGIAGGQYIFLLSLKRHNGCSQEEIASFLKMDKTTTAKAIKKLEENGFIDRQTDEDDKRAYKVFLTQKALDALPEIYNAVEAWEKLMLSGITPEEYDQLERLLGKMAQNVFQDDPGPIPSDSNS